MMRNGTNILFRPIKMSDETLLVEKRTVAGLYELKMTFKE